jgi:hypothetical protein
VGRTAISTGFWWWNLEETDHLENLGIYGRTILKYIFEKQNGRASIGFIWLRIGTTGRLF